MRILHTMLRVGDLQRSIRFYTNVLGMKMLRTTDRPEQKYTLAFVGYGDESEHAVLELTYNYGVDRYDLGSGYGHVAIEVPDAAAACAAVRAAVGEYGDYLNRTRGTNPLFDTAGFTRDWEALLLAIYDAAARSPGHAC